MRIRIVPGTLGDSEVPYCVGQLWRSCQRGLELTSSNHAIKPGCVQVRQCTTHARTHTNTQAYTHAHVFDEILTFKTMGQYES